MGAKLDGGFVVPFGKKERSTYYFLTALHLMSFNLRRNISS